MIIVLLGSMLMNSLVNCCFGLASSSGGGLALLTQWYSTVVCSTSRVYSSTVRAASAQKEPGSPR